MNILVVEDDPAVASFVVAALKKDGYKVIHVEDLPQAIDTLAANQFHCIVLDRSLPSGDAIEWITQAKRHSPTEFPPVLFLTALDTLEDKLTGLALGDDYLVKPFSIEEVLARINALIRRSLKSENLLQGAGIKLDRIHRNVERNGIPISLKPMEFKLLEYLLLHKNQIVTRQMLLEHVWEYNFEPATTIVETYISRLRRKLEISDLPAAIRTERGNGYSITAD
ncbi:Phosphate regulon transcriptional regulatory protein PhoB [Thalassocella blandensis]|nr:Phosphate regulon transcriptional regulatory protein PhoB [Thalassocella blandensis]